jgi:hypothetical protein
MRIGFLYNHDATHQVPHTIPIAAALAGRGVDVEILTSSQEQRAVAAGLLGDAARVRYTALNVGAASAIADRVLRHVAPFRRIAVLRQNLGVFGSLDALVVPETTSSLLRSRFGLTSPKLIYVPHGAGDGAAGFQAATRRFDLVLLSGAKVRDRMLSLGLVSEDRARIVGYPKFDLFLGAARAPHFDNGRPTVLYNPHFNPALSSWYRMGPRVLRWFAAQDRFNLIFAPHVMLFRRLAHTSLIHRRIALRPAVPRAVRDHPGLLIDTGSARSIDMSHVAAADIYLGDVSSQIYEWIQRPRPAIFLDAHGPDWRAMPDYRHWALGEVTRRVQELPAALDRALAAPDRFAALQRDAATATFSTTGEHAGQRAATAILEFMADARQGAATR